MRYNAQPGLVLGHFLADVSAMIGNAMTEKLFWKDPYQTELVSQIVSLKGNEVELSETIFYAESGGQESDVGTMNGIPVLKAEKREQTIIYTLAEVDGLTVGSEVITKIDWPRRYALMKLHFAAEVVLELFTQTYSINKIGAHISAEKSRIDFEWNDNISTLLPDFQIKAMSLINADLPIESYFSDFELQRRCWEVKDFAKVPCGGTHLKRTSEVGSILLKRKNIGKGKERVEISLA